MRTITTFYLMCIMDILRNKTPATLQWSKATTCQESHINNMGFRDVVMVKVDPVNI